MNKLTMQVAKPHRTSLSCKCTVSKKKRNQNFVRSISYKTRVMKFGTPFSDCICFKIM